MSGLEGMGATYAMRLRSNSRLDEAAQAICPEVPKVGGVDAFREFQHTVKTWGTARRVVVKFQVPETKDGAAALFAESFYFVTNLSDAPTKVVEHYLNRGEAERRFGEFVGAFEPTFRHAEMAKNEARAQDSAHLLRGDGFHRNGIRSHSLAGFHLLPQGGGAW